MRRLVATALVLGFAATATAQPESAYYGLALGSFEYQEDGIIDDKADSYRLMVGYQFMEHMAVEGGFGKTGTIRGTLAVSDPFLGPFTVDLGTEFQIMIIRVLGVLNFDSGVTLLGGLGFAEMKQDLDIVFNPAVLPPQSDGLDISEPTYFAGVQYDWDRVAVRLGYEKYDFSGGVDVEETSLTFFYKL